MSYLFPKRISELATIDSDLDTPDKQNNKNSYRWPKRVAELDLQESDSEDDKNDKLNCAILNDSFVLSPSKDLEFGNTPLRKAGKSEKPPSTSDENNRNVTNKRTFESDPDSGFLSRISNTKITNTTENETPATVQPLRQSRSRTQLFPAKTDEASVPSIFRSSSVTAVKPEVKLEAPPQKNLTATPVTKQNSMPTDDHPSSETPFKKTTEPHVFATPSLRPTQSMTATTSRKLTNPQQPAAPQTCEKPQAKILFTTPIARPPGRLVESTPIGDMRGPVGSLRKLSPIREPAKEASSENQKILTINSIEYIIDKKIGSGGSSSVFLARGRKSSKEFAIKLVTLDGDQAVIDGYLNETKLLAKLQGNINVVSLFDYCHLPEKSILYMVMEKGESDLHKILQGYRTHIPLYTLVKYWYQMLQAVNYIHMNGVIHSDLKPANFLMIGGRLKLIDFGIASNIAIDSTSIIKFSQAGTFNYISPEALIDTSSGDSPSHHQPKIRLSTKSDVWSLGCILYLLLYKKTPFSHIKVIHQKITALTNPRTAIEYPQLPSFYPPVLVDMVRMCLVYNPKERSSVADLLKYPFEMLIPLDEMK